MSRRTRMRLWLMDHLPAGLITHPAEWFVAFLCALGGIPAILGIVKSQSLESLLPLAVYRVWGTCLLIGGVAVMIGLASIRHTPSGHHVVTKLPIYRLGLRLLLVATLCYAAALLVVSGLNAVLACVTLAAFGGMCAIRLLSLGGRP